MLIDLDQVGVPKLTTERLNGTQSGVVGRIGGLVDLLPEGGAASSPLVALGGGAGPVGIVQVERDRQHAGQGIGEEPREPRRIGRAVRPAEPVAVCRDLAASCPWPSAAGSPINSMIPRYLPSLPIWIASLTGSSSNAGSSSMLLANGELVQSLEDHPATSLSFQPMTRTGGCPSGPGPSVSQCRTPRTTSAWKNPGRLTPSAPKSMS